MNRCKYSSVYNNQGIKPDRSIICMYKNLFAFIVIVIGSLTIVAQTENPVKPSVVSGEVLSAGSTAIVIKAQTGDVNAVISEKTQFKRVKMIDGKFSAADSTAASLADIAVGDKVMATGILAADGRSLPARTIYLLSKADISARDAKESEQWKTRGIAGKVTAVNTQTGQITISVRGIAGTTPVIITQKSNAVFKRYAPDSIAYSNATLSSINDIRTGDMLRALGDKSGDGTSFLAEEVLSGAFQTVAGTIKSIDTANKEVVIADISTGKDVTIFLGTASVMKEFPAEMSERMAAFQNGGQGGARPMTQPAGQAGQGGEARPNMGSNGMRPAGMGGGRGGNLDDMLDRLPNITLDQLKVGSAIAVSSSKVDGAAKLNAIKLLAGVEPFLRSTQAQQSGRRGGRTGVDSGFTIPGLDDFGTP